MTTLSYNGTEYESNEILLLRMLMAQIPQEILEKDHVFTYKAVAALLAYINYLEEQVNLYD